MRFLITFIFLNCYLLSYAQNYVDLAKISYSSTPYNSYDSLNGVKTQLQEFSTDITLPIVLDSSKSLITGVLFEQISLVNQPSSQTTFYTINPKFGVNLNHSEKLTGTYILLPKLSSDLKGGLNSKHFQFGGVGLFTLKKSPYFKYKIGAYFNQELFSPFVVPILGFYYQKNNIEANFTLPVFADINYKLSNNFKTGITFNAIVKSFLLNEFPNQYITKTTNEVYTYLQVNLPNYRILIEPQIGYSIARSFSVYDTSDKIDFKLSAFEFGPNQNPLNYNFNDGLIFKVRLVYRFVLENN